MRKEMGHKKYLPKQNKTKQNILTGSTGVFLLLRIFSLIGRQMISIVGQLTESVSPRF